MASWCRTRRSYQQANGSFTIRSLINCCIIAMRPLVANQEELTTLLWANPLGLSSQQALPEADVAQFTRLTACPLTATDLAINQPQVLTEIQDVRSRAAGNPQAQKGFRWAKTEMSWET